MSSPELRIERGYVDAEEWAAVLVALRRRPDQQRLARWRSDRVAALRRFPRN